MNMLPFFMGAQSAPNIEDLFSITLDTAANLDGVSTTGWDLLVGKSRVNATDWVWRDSAQGISDYIESNTTNAAAAFSDYATLMSAGNGLLYRLKRAPKFFDVVTWTGDGVSGREIAHNLNAEIGFLVIKRLDSAVSWSNWHRSLGTSSYLHFETTAAAEATGNLQAWSSTSFTVAGGTAANASGGTYVAYLFAHDTSASGIIQAVSVTTDGSGNASCAHGWAEGVQFAGLKCSTTTGDWEFFDTARSPSWTTDLRLRPNLANAEDTVTRISDTGGTISFANLSASQTYIAFFIRAPS